MMDVFYSGSLEQKFLYSLLTVGLWSAGLGVEVSFAPGMLVLSCPQPIALQPPGLVKDTESSNKDAQLGA